MTGLYHSRVVEVVTVAVRARLGWEEVRVDWRKGAQEEGSPWTLRTSGRRPRSCGSIQR